MKLWWNDEISSEWILIQRWGDGYAFMKKDLRVIIDCGPKDETEIMWIHVSYSRANWIPTHKDTLIIKKEFLKNRYAYAVFPPEEKYVNIHNNCLHLWARLDGVSVLPEFSSVIPGVGNSI